MSGTEIIYGLESIIEKRRTTLPHIPGDKGHSLSRRIEHIEEFIRTVQELGIYQKLFTHHSPEEIKRITGSTDLSSLPHQDLAQKHPDLPFGISYNGKATQRIIVGSDPIELYPACDKSVSIMIADKHKYISSITTLSELIRMLIGPPDNDMSPAERFDSFYNESDLHEGLEGKNICATRVVHPRKPVYIGPVREFTMPKYNVLIGYSGIPKNGKTNGKRVRIMTIDQRIRD